MHIYNDYDFKPLEKRFEILFQNKSKKLFNPWESSYDAAKLASIMYKFDLYDSIKTALKNGIDPSKIFIINGNFIDQKQILKTDVENKLKAFENLTNIGKIVPLYPNSYLSNLSLLYSFKKESRQFSRKHNFNCFSDQEFNVQLELLLQNNENYSFKKVLDHLANKTIVKIEKFHTHQAKLLNEYNLIVKKYSFQIDKADEFHRSKNKKTIDKFLINNHSIDINHQEQYQYFYRPFHDLLINMEKPIVGVFEEDGLKFNIFCKSAIVYSDQMPQAFIDLFLMSHNSPFKKKYLIPLSIVSILHGSFYALISDWKEIESTLKIREERKSIELDNESKRQKLNKSLLKEIDKTKNEIKSKNQEDLNQYDIHINEYMRV